ncbi:MAG: ROK family protein [Candidatus Woesebacteria bacterium]|nr:ROK family protein [Candidatus Woesebacteria bacterium]
MYIAIDIGGTRTRLAASSSLDNPEIADREEFATSDNFDKNYQNILSFIGLKTRIAGIGISIPGDLDEDKSTVVKNAQHTPCYLGSPVKKLLLERYKCPIQMDNDGAAAALGEAVYGNGKGVDFAYITWGTGIGGALVKYFGGKPIVTQLDWDKYLSSWETSCGGKSLEKLYGKSAEQLTENEWEEVFEAFRKELLEFTDKLHPQRVVFGGGISLDQSARLQQIKGGKTTVEITGLGEDTGLFGAFALIR